MSFWESKKIKKTRKPHKCAYCRTTIPVGSSCNNEVGTYEGDFNSYYLCERCLLFIEMFEDKSESELGDFDYTLCCTDLLDCPECGYRNHRKYEYLDRKQGASLECDNCDHKWTVDLTVEGLKSYKIKTS